MNFMEFFEHRTALTDTEGVALADKCTEAKRCRDIVSLIKECFGANHTFSPMVGKSGTGCRMRGNWHIPSPEARVQASCAERTVTNLSPLTSHFSREGKRYAFTFAEVLITIGIIGVVAALTLPSVIANYQKKNVETRLKQDYSIFSSAVKMAEAEKGELQNWDFRLSNVDFYNTYLKNYLKVNDTMLLSQLNGQTVWQELNGLLGSTLISSPNTYILKLSNGNLIFISPSINDTYKVLGIDVNGLSKPNTIGKDFFYFMISSDFGFTPYGYGYDNKRVGEFAGKNFTREDLINGRDDIQNYALCKKGSSGQLCTLLMYTDGWQIAPDYPW